MKWLLVVSCSIVLFLAGCSSSRKVPTRPLPADKTAELHKLLFGELQTVLEREGDQVVHNRLIPSLALTGMRSEQESNAVNRIKLAELLVRDKDGLRESTRYLTSVAPGATFRFILDDSRATLETVRGLLGPEDGSEKGTGPDNGATFYDFGWIRLGYYPGCDGPAYVICSTARFGEAGE